MTKFVHGRVIKLDEPEPLNLEETNNEIERLAQLFNPKKREKRFFNAAPTDFNILGREVVASSEL